MNGSLTTSDCILHARGDEFKVIFITNQFWMFFIISYKIRGYNLIKGIYCQKLQYSETENKLLWHMYHIN